MFMRSALVAVDQTLIDDRKPTCTTEEIDGYVWETLANGSDTRNAKETPLKKDDHGMDTLRYFVAYIDDITAGIEDTEAVIIVDDPVSISPL
jgi:phage terminase large subunit